MGGRLASWMPRASGFPNANRSESVVMRSSGKLGIGGTALGATERFRDQIYLIANAGCWIRYYQPGLFALPPYSHIPYVPH